MGPEGLLPSSLEFCIIQLLTLMNKRLGNKRKRMDAIVLARGKMTTVNVDMYIAQAIKPKLTLATHFVFSPGNELSVYFEQNCK